MVEQTFYFRPVKCVNGIAYKSTKKMSFKSTSYNVSVSVKLKMKTKNSVRGEGQTFSPVV